MLGLREFDEEMRDSVEREVMDPITGELIDINDRQAIVAMHDRLEGIALDILSACRQIGAALALERPARLKVWNPYESPLQVVHAPGKE